MSKRKPDIPEIDALRKKAEKLLKKKTKGAKPVPSEADGLKLIHELEVHQIEPEMQNNELLEAKAQSEISSNNYAELYDSAPTGYVTLSRKGEVRKLNAAVENMLGKTFLQIKDSMFGFFISDENKPVFSLFLDNIFERKIKHSCEVILIPEGKEPVNVFLIGISSDNGKKCLLTVVDVSELRKAEQEILLSRREISLQEELKTANIELRLQNEEMGKRSAELVIANKELKFQNEEKAKRAEELVIANKELKFQNEEKAKRAAELVIANKELKFQNEEKAKRAEELVIANKELKFQNEEKAKRAEELINANKEYKFQNEEKAKRDAKLVIAKKELEFEVLISDSNNLFKEIEHRLNERNKELQALYGLSQLADNEILNFESLCRKVLNIMKGAWQHPKVTCCRIIADGAEYCTENFAETEWKQSAPLKVNGEVIGSIDVLYLKKMKEADEGPFLTEERNLINDLAERMGHIIQRVRAEEKKQKDDALIHTLSLAIEQSPVTTVITDTEGNIEFVNPKFIETTGYTSEEAIGKNTRILKSEYTPGHVHKELWDTILSGKNWYGEFQNRKKNGELYFESAVISPVKNDDGNIIRFLALKQDITQRKITEEKLRISEERFETLAEHSRVITWEVDANGLYTYMSDVCRAVIGYTPEDVTGRMHFYDIHPEENREAFRSAAFAVFEKKVAFRGLENEIETKNGETVWVSTNGIPILDADGNLKGYKGTDTDITERKKGEEEIMNMNKELIELNSEKDKFFSIIAHDLRGPFNGFLGLTNIFASELSKMNLEDIQKLALMMKNSANNLYQLLENLLEWSQMKRGLSVTNPKQFSLKKIICENILLLNEIASKKEITINSDIQGDLQVFADKYMIESAFRNILSNAIKFTDKGGIISVSAKLTADNLVELSVSDNGIGMNKERMENLFRLDVNTNRKGTDGEASAGLGLLICKEFLEMNRGQLFLESEVGKGSTFRFTLPYCDDNCYKKHEQKNAKKEKNKSERIQNLKILIAEDDQISAKLLARTLNTISREILNAGTGLEAVEICRNNPDIDLVLMDIKMPVMDGFEAARQIRKFNKDVILIAQTAFAQDGYDVKAKEAGFNDSITKLFDINLFEELLKNYFG